MKKLYNKKRPFLMGYGLKGAIVKIETNARRGSIDEVVEAANKMKKEG